MISSSISWKTSITGRFIFIIPLMFFLKWTFYPQFDWDVLSIFLVSMLGLSVGQCFSDYSIRKEINVWFTYGKGTWAQILDPLRTQPKLSKHNSIVYPHVPSTRLLESPHGQRWLLTVSVTTWHSAGREKVQWASLLNIGFQAGKKPSLHSMVSLSPPSISLIFLTL